MPEYGEAITQAYSAKNGYKWLNKEDTMTLRRGITPPLMDLQAFYNRLWNLQLASKIKITFWKIINNYMPTFNSLKAINLTVINICLLSRLMEESVVHVFWECMTSKDILHGVRIDTSPNTQGQYWKIWLAGVFTKMNKE